MGNIDFHGRFLEIRRNYTRGRIATPKSGESRRVDMSHELTQTLKDLYTERRLEAAANRWKEVPHWVFAMSTDNYAVRIAFHQLLKTAGLRHVRFHDLRHTF
ncbi:MAG: hypothetical protein C4293_11790, partial [Nitrospiraceae bacterium]